MPKNECLLHSTNDENVLLDIVLIARPLLKDDDRKTLVFWSTSCQFSHVDYIPNTKNDVFEAVNGMDNVIRLLLSRRRTTNLLVMYSVWSWDAKKHPALLVLFTLQPMAELLWFESHCSGYWHISCRVITHGQVWLIWCESEKYVLYQILIDDSVAY